MRAILVDPEKKSFEEIDFVFDTGNPEPLCALLGCRRFTAPTYKLIGSIWDGLDRLYVSDDDMVDRAEDQLRHWFQLDADRDPPSSRPLTGKGLVVGIPARRLPGSEGVGCDARISIDELRSRITFTRRKWRGFSVKLRPVDVGIACLRMHDVVQVDRNAQLIDGLNEEDGE